MPVQKRRLISTISQHIGKRSGGHTTKTHVVVDALGNPLYFQLSSENLHDSVLAIEVLEHVEIQCSNIIGDREYGSLAIRTYVSTHEVTYTTLHPRKIRKNLGLSIGGCITNVIWWSIFLIKLKQFRHIATRYDKLATSYLAFVYIAAIFLLTK